MKERCVSIKTNYFFRTAMQEKSSHELLYYEICDWFSLKQLSWCPWQQKPSHESWFVLVPMVYMRFFSTLMSSFCVNTLMCVIPVIAMTHLISEVHLALTISNNWFYQLTGKWNINSKWTTNFFCGYRTACNPQQNWKTWARLRLNVTIHKIIKEEKFCVGNLTLNYGCHLQYVASVFQIKTLPVLWIAYKYKARETTSKDE